MKLLGALIAFLGCALAQSAAANAASVLRIVRVDLCLVALLAYALGAGTERGLVLGVLAGLATDLLGGGRLGVGALGYGVVGFMAGSVPETFFPGTALVRGVLLFISGTICSLIIYNALRVYGAAHGYATVLGCTIAPMLAATAVIGALLMALVDRVRVRMLRHD
ncbi:MAG: rod shape-determining protein MreD [Verrucomicrobia bacterium]|nr:rod shape-determining protein MreD [Verrucomicrobiota bacterium]